MTSNKILAWLKSHELIPLNGLDKIVGIPIGTTKRAMNITGIIPEKHIKPLVKELKRYGYK